MKLFIIAFISIFITSSSYSSCEQELKDIEEAKANYKVSAVILLEARTYTEEFETQLKSDQETNNSTLGDYLVSDSSLESRKSELIELKKAVTILKAANKLDKTSYEANMSLYNSCLALSGQDLLSTSDIEDLIDEDRVNALAEAKYNSQS